MLCKFYLYAVWRTFLTYLENSLTNEENCFSTYNKTLIDFCFFLQCIVIAITIHPCGGEKILVVKCPFLNRMNVECIFCFFKPPCTGDTKMLFQMNIKLFCRLVRIFCNVSSRLPCVFMSSLCVAQFCLFISRNLKNKKLFLLETGVLFHF